jgi:hypothetical protein
MGNVSSGQYVNNATGNYISQNLDTNYVKVSELPTYFSNYDTTSLAPKYATYAAMGSGHTYHSTGTINCVASNTIYGDKSNVQFSSVDANSIMSYSNGVFTVLTSFTGGLQFNLTLSRYAAGNDNNPMLISLKKGSNYVWMGGVSSSSGLSTLNDTVIIYGNVSIPNVVVSDPSQCGNTCNNYTQCAGWSWVKNTYNSSAFTAGNCVFYSDVTNNVVYNPHYNLYYIGSSSPFQNFINISFNAGDTFSIEVSRACTVSGTILMSYGNYS